MHLSEEIRSVYIGVVFNGLRESYIDAVGSYFLEGDWVIIVCPCAVGECI